MRTRSNPASSCARANARRYSRSIAGPRRTSVSEPTLAPIMPMNSMGISTSSLEGDAPCVREDRVVLRAVDAAAQGVAQVALQRVVARQPRVADERDRLLGD